MILIGVMGVGDRIWSDGIREGVERLGKKHDIPYETLTHRDKERLKQLVLDRDRIVAVGHSMGVDTINDVAGSTSGQIDHVFAVASAYSEAFPANVKNVTWITASADYFRRGLKATGQNVKNIRLKATHTNVDDLPVVWDMVEGALKEVSVKQNMFEQWTPKFMQMLVEDFQVSVEDAAAVFGNAGHESAGYETLQEIKPLVPGSRGGWGIMQWTGPRRKAFEAYCKRNGFDPSDMEVNYKWLWNELKGPEGRVLSKLRAAKTLREKTKVFSDVFLRPGIPHMASRYKWSERALEAWGGREVIEVPEAPTEPISGDLSRIPTDDLYSAAIQALDRHKEILAELRRRTDITEGEIITLTNEPATERVFSSQKKETKMTFDFIKPSSKTFWVGAVNVIAGVMFLLAPESQIADLLKTFVGDQEPGTLISIGLGLIFAREAIAKNGTDA